MVYHSEDCPATDPNGWNCHVDACEEVYDPETEKGGHVEGKFYESFFGVFHVLDCKDYGTHLHITPNPYFSWLPIVVFVEFCQRRPCPESPEAPSGEGHRVRFFFPIGGLNRFNPFGWLTIMYVGLCLRFFSKRSFTEFKESTGVISPQSPDFEHDADETQDETQDETLLDSLKPFFEKFVETFKGGDVVEDKTKKEYFGYVRYESPTECEEVRVNPIIRDRAAREAGTDERTPLLGRLLGRN